MKILILTLLIYTCPLLAVAANIECVIVNGEFKIWNGWPPTLRLVSAKQDTIYGVADTTKIPDPIKQMIKDNLPIKGQFCLSKTGVTVTVPYQKQPIVLVDIVDYEPK